MNNSYELDWNSPIEKDSPDFVVLPEGDYDFEIVNFERGRHQGSEKLPPCNKATVHIKISAPEGTTTIKHNLYLHSNTEGLLCSFFTGIGQRKQGERVTMNWNTVVGSKGRAKVGIHKWTNDDGKEFAANQIVKFYEPQSIYQQNSTYQPGRF